MASLAPGTDAAPAVAPHGLRHPLFVRITHWITAFCIIALIVTGAEILAHHPELYWGETGFFGDPYFLSFGKEEYEYIGMGNARSIHFLAAWILAFNVIVYVALGLAKGHVWRDLLPDRDQLGSDHIRREIYDHIRLHHDEAELARRYNLLQKLAYLAVVFVLTPVILLTGLAMSPSVTAQYHWLIEMWGGRQTARSIHFLAAISFLAFLLIHVWQVWLVGFRHHVGAMITGRLHTAGEEERT